MRGADVNVRVDVVGPMIVIATQLNEAELSRRHKQVRTTNLITTSKQLSLHISFLCVFDQSRAELLFLLTAQKALEVQVVQGGCVLCGDAALLCMHTV